MDFYDDVDGCDVMLFEICVLTYAINQSCEVLKKARGEWTTSMSQTKSLDE
jgi:hypothetical protein